MLFIYIYIYIPQCLPVVKNVSGTLRGEKKGDISINNWKHMKSNFTYAVMEQEAASQI